MMRQRAVIVVAFHGTDDISQALARFVGELIIVVDNSSDPQVRATAAAYKAHYLDVGANLGFAAGVNRGIAWLVEFGAWVDGACDVLLLNPDARLDSASLDALAEALLDPARPGLAAVAPSQVNPVTGMPQRLLWPFPSPWHTALWVVGGWGMLPDEFLVGSAILLRSEALADVGPFDERYFLYAEETDWQRRASDAGWSVAVVPHVQGTHRGGGSSTDEALREARRLSGLETYLRRWYGAPGWHACRALHVVGYLARWVARRDPAFRRSAAMMVRGPRRCAGLPVLRGHGDAQPWAGRWVPELPTSEVAAQ